jgi:hypothetical protein
MKLPLETAFLLAATVVQFGCTAQLSESNEAGSPPPDAAIDAPGVDSASPDAASDAPVDARGDESPAPDSGRDATTDAPADALPDGATDATTDAAIDAATDAGVPTTIDRQLDPVVFTGADATALVGLAPASLVAFAYRAGSWTQVPVQVDQRVAVDLGAIYAQAATGVMVTVYADPKTNVGADPNPDIDADDEIVFMAGDAADRAPAGSLPNGVVAGTGVEVTLSDPLTNGTPTYAYLFEQAGSLDPGAGQKYVTYTFAASSSTVVTDAYSEHFVGRWINDQLQLTSGAATGVDILDQNKVQFGPGQGCGENEQTFNQAEGVFIADTDGPVRGVRSFVGAASGPYTQQDHLFYRSRQDTRTFLRVHPIPGIMELVDYSQAAVGMTYYNDGFLAGDTIDGVAPSTAPPPTARAWELVTGLPGSVAYSYDVASDIAGLGVTLYYEDNASDNECTPGGHSYGLSGPYVTTSIPCTDPTLASCTGAVSHLTGVRIAYFGAPGWTAADGPSLDALAKNPLVPAFGAF